MDIRDLRYLAASVSAGNFGRAARSLGLNASTISRRIARLEDELGLTLFERGHAGVRLTAAGRAVMLHVTRALAELDAVARTGRENGSGSAGEIRLGVALPPIGAPLSKLLADWRAKHPNVLLTMSEMNGRDLAAALEERRLDAALIQEFKLWPHASSLPICRERLIVALPVDHPLAEREALSWTSFDGEKILVQGWEESQAQREFLASFLGSGAKFHAHAAGKQSMFALVGAGFGITFAVESQSEATFPGLVFRPIDEADARVVISLAWMPEAEEPIVGRFIAFMRDEARSRRLV